MFGTSGKPRTAYVWVALLIVATGVVNVLTAAQHSTDLSSLRGPLLDEASSALVLIALLPILKRAVDALSTASDRRIAFIVVALSIVAYALLHVVLMVTARQVIYPVFGGHYGFQWESQFGSEFRKDIISAFMIVVVFWLIDRRSTGAPVGAANDQSEALTRERKPTEIWLKDGSTNVRVDPREISSVTSAGNYVEFTLPARRYLIRGTLAGEQTRLEPFGFARVHRTKLVNTGRIVAVKQRPNGDFLVRLDTGEEIAGSRRYREGIAAMITGDRSGAKV